MVLVRIIVNIVCQILDLNRMKITQYLEYLCLVEII